MKLSRIVFLGGLSSLALSTIAFWQRSNAVPARQTYQVAAIAQPTTIAAISTAPALTAPVQPAIPIPPASTPPATLVAPAVTTASSSPIAQANLRTIATCNGLPGNANFRSAPSLAPGTVLGVVAQGEAIALTGRTAIGDGVLWYEAIAPALYPSPDAEAQNKLEEGQTGWIASCFVDG